VHFDEQQQLWNVLGYQDVAAALSDPGTFSSDFTGLVPVQEDFELFRRGNFVGMDPPDHRRLRKLVSQAFTPRVVADLAPRIAAVTDELLDAADDQDVFDLMDVLAHPLPVIVIAELLGIPVSDRPVFRRWASVLFDNDRFSDGMGPEQIEAALQEIAPTIREMNDYILAHVAERRAHPKEDLTTKLIQATGDGETGGRGLDDEEILGFVGLLLVAGHITTTALLGNTALSLADHPDAERELRADPSLLPTALEEELRHRAPFPRLGRRTTADVVLSGTAIPAGQIVMLGVASANRDESVFDEPDRFDIRRRPNPHLTFGHGIHFCLGAGLARVEARVAVELLFRRFRTMTVTGPVAHQNPMVIVGAKQLPVAVTRR
jgi:cytochrome P450